MFEIKITCYLQLRYMWHRKESVISVFSCVLVGPRLESSKSGCKFCLLDKQKSDYVGILAHRYKQSMNNPSQSHVNSSSLYFIGHNRTYLTF